jgi:four helix bundle protein
MGRLRAEFLERVEVFGSRMIDLAVAIRRKVPSQRIVDQMIGSGTSVGSNVFEADEAMSMADFIKCVGISVKEVNESRYWIRMTARKGWVASKRLGSLEAECLELKRFMGAMIANGKRGRAKK